MSAMGDRVKTIYDQSKEQREAYEEYIRAMRQRELFDMPKLPTRRYATGAIIDPGGICVEVTSELRIVLGPEILQQLQTLMAMVSLEKLAPAPPTGS